MQRISITIDDDLLGQLDGFMTRHGYANRSEAVRDLVRHRLEQDRVDTGEATHCVATLSYVYDHMQRELAKRLTHAQHDHHDLTLSTLHVHLDHENCLEAMVLRGETTAVRAFADGLMAERGVRHGALHVVPTELETRSHAHGPADHGHGPHVHSRPKT